MKTALLGYTGFVGSNIAEQNIFTDYYNSKNITQIVGKKYDLIVSCATSSLFWKANIEPEKDWENIQKLIDNLSKVEASTFILISTIFVYPKPYLVDEYTIINPALLTPYGLHRYKLEQFIKKKFKQSIIIRLPNLYGNGLKKNFIYDLIYRNRWDLTHKDSKMQWYNLKHIWKDILIVKENKLSVVNFAVAPVSAKKIAKYSLGISFTNITEKEPLNNRMLTLHSKIFGKKTGFLYSQKQTLEELKDFITHQK